MRTTGMQALRLRIGGARASGEVGVYCAQLGLSSMFYAHHMNDIQLPWSFFNIMGWNSTDKSLS